MAAAMFLRLMELLLQCQGLAITTKAKGYQLYPYFGGNELAPHDMHIWIKDL
jgi:hypothetical protein